MCQLKLQSLNSYHQLPKETGAKIDISLFAHLKTFSSYLCYLDVHKLGSCIPDA